MRSNILFFIVIIVSFLPFILFAYFNSKANVKKENRNRQYAMPVIAVIYSVILLIVMDRLSLLLLNIFFKIVDLFDKIKLPAIGEFLLNCYSSWGIYLVLVLFNTVALLVYIILKRIITVFLGRLKIERNTFIGSVVELFYSYDEIDDSWFIKEHFGQARTFIKTAYYGGCFVSGLTLLISCGLCLNNLISAPFYPVFAVIIIGEMAFFIDGIEKDEQKGSFAVKTDDSRRVAMYPLLRRPLKALFGDKLSAEGTTVNNGGLTGGAIEDILISIERNGGHIGKNYSLFIRKKMEKGLKPNVDYVRCGFDLAIGKSLLFNTPFYDKLNPYVFYAMNRELLTGGKVLIVLGRHGTDDDLYRWTENGMKKISNIPDLWKIKFLKNQKVNEENLPDIGIISRSAVHDLHIHKNNLAFLRNVSFVVVVEPSLLVTTAQIGLNLLIRCCGKERSITFCSIDRNCDGLVDALSHILMTNITEVSATEYPRGMSSYMYWTADDDYLQHRILPGVSRYLGMGTEISMVALKNQVKKAIWYGGDAFPVIDAHWIAKQYYYDLLDYAQLPTNQETFNNCFQTSFNMCNEQVSDFSFICVEDDRNNLFETRRNFATIAEEQGFVNVISSEYMLREYMADNTEIFLADPKAIPYITADFAHTKRNSILSICLLLCIDCVKEDMLLRKLAIINIDNKEPVSEIWREICTIFGNNTDTDKQGNLILSVKNNRGKIVSFEKDSTILFKRQYDVENGKFESVYTIENDDFLHIILDDLQNASYIAEQENKDIYLGTELKGHIYQKYMPGQFLTLNGKYYEMLYTTSDNRILVRRASEHIDGRLSYRQIRHYTISCLEDYSSMGSLKSINNINIHYQYANFSVDTPGYWKMRSRNDFDNGVLVKVNGVPTREYYRKQILKFDFSKFGDAFTDSIRMTLTNLLNEVFVTLFADNQAYICAVTPGMYDAPLTYSLELTDNVEKVDKCIFIIEDSQLDIGLLIAVERNVNRIFQIVLDYLLWNNEKIAKSMQKENSSTEETNFEPINVSSENEEPKSKQGLFKRICGCFKNLFKKKKNKVEQETQTENSELEELTPKQRKKAEKKARKKQEKVTKKDTEVDSDTKITEEKSDDLLQTEEVVEKESSTIDEEVKVNDNPPEESIAEEISSQNKDEVNENE